MLVPAFGEKPKWLFTLVAPARCGREADYLHEDAFRINHTATETLQYMLPYMDGET